MSIDWIVQVLIANILAYSLSVVLVLSNFSWSFAQRPFSYQLIFHSVPNTTCDDRIIFALPNATFPLNGSASALNTQCTRVTTFDSGRTTCWDGGCQVRADAASVYSTLKGRQTGITW